VAVSDELIVSFIAPNKSVIPLFNKRI